MNLQTYLDKTGTKRADFARSLGVSPDLVYQWIKSIRPVAAKHCKAINTLSGGKISLFELRPDDWQTYWPELTPPKPRKPTRRPLAPP